MGALNVSSTAYTGTQAIPAAFDWVAGTLLGGVALGLCILAVAYIGFLMLLGRLPVREGLRVVLGCFILFAAPVIASAFVGLANQDTPLQQASAAIEDNPRGELPPADYDPYAGASLRRD